MIIDNFLRVSSAQAVTNTAVSTNVIDLLQARDIGEGEEELYFHFKVDTAFTAAGAATLRAQIITSANSDLSSPTVLDQTADIALAQLAAGARFTLPIPRQVGGTGQRYLGINYLVTTGPMTAGAITADIVMDVEDFKTYPSGFTVQ